MADNKRAPAPRGAGTEPADKSSKSEIERFLAEARSLAPAGDGRGRLIFALDATMSRQPTWDTAQALQSQMFAEAAKVGKLEIQLVYYRGFNECRASKWVADGGALARLMTGIEVRGGQTQIGRILAHAKSENAKRKVSALVFIGDAMEEPVDRLAAIAGELGLLGVKAFVFQEGNDPTVERAFREIARLSGGAYAHFDVNAADQLAALLRAVAAYAAGGMKALAKAGGTGGQLLLAQLR